MMMSANIPVSLADVDEFPGILFSLPNSCLLSLVVTFVFCLALFLLSC